MAYSDFTLSSLTKRFNLTLETGADLYGPIPAVTPEPAFLRRLQRDMEMALQVSTERSRSEFIIAPILAEARYMAQNEIALFSGVEFTVDALQDLSGFCDYIVTRSRQQMFVESPVLMLVEAKNEDMKRGYAQCFAEMIAAQLFNARQERDVAKIYGAVSIGNQWKFLELEGATARIDRTDYYIEHVDKIMGILLSMATGQMTPSPTP